MTLGDMPVDVISLIIEATFAATRQCYGGPIPASKLESRLRDDVLFPLAMQAVSRAFFCATRSLPSLWTTVTDATSLSCCFSFLERSAVQPLTVGILAFQDAVGSAFSPFLLAVQPQAHRWQAIYFVLSHGHTDTEGLGSARDTLFPTLGYTDTLDGRQRALYAVTLDQVLRKAPYRAPRLGQSLLGSAEQQRTALKSLESLNIHLPEPRADVPQLWATLSGCALLRRLHMDISDWCRYFVEHDAPSTTFGGPVRLDTLQHLTVRFEMTNIHDVAWVACTLHCPVLRTFCVSAVNAAPCPLLSWLEALLSPRAVGCAPTLHHLSLDFSETDLSPVIGEPTLVEYLFRESTFTSLTRLSFSIGTFSINATDSRSWIAAFESFPSSLDLLDMTKVALIHRDAMLQLLERLCEAGSHATLRVSMQAVYFEASTRGMAMEQVQKAYRQARASGRMKFKVDWVGTTDSIVPVK